MKTLRNLIAPLARAAMIVLVVAAPLVAAQSVRAGNEIRIEAEAPANTGLGLVLLVSIQRAQ
ncbi:MAG: hypothetical protein AB7I79_07085 [Rhizobiaceae bacterium]